MDEPDAPAADAPMDTVPAQDPRGTARRLLGLLRPHRMLLIGVTALGVGGTAANVFGPLLLGRATDLVFAGAVGRQLPTGLTQAELVARLGGQGQDAVADIVATSGAAPGRGVDFAAVGGVLLLATALYAAASLFVLVQQRLTAKVVQQIAYELREGIDRKLSRLPVAYFDRASRGDLLGRATNDVDNLQQAMQQVLTQLVTSVLAVLAVLVIMLIISPLLTLVLLLVAPVSAVAAGALGRRAQPRFREQWAATGTLTSHVEEVYTGHALVTAFDQRDATTRVLEQHNRQLADHARYASSLSGTIQPAMMLGGNLTYVLVAAIGALRVAAGALTVGSLQAFVQYSGQFSQPMVQLAGVAEKAQSGLASAERILAMLDAPEELPDPDVPAVPSSSRGEVRFERVSFRYSSDVPLIEELSFTVAPGVTVAVVGTTGAGKTTLGNLLLRFYEPTAGRVLLDGVDVAGMRRNELRRRIGLVPQDVWLCQGTIADNIRFGRPDATRDEVVAAARAVGVDRFVRMLPDGYDTVLDEGTSSISVGERQLITVARAFLTDPMILLLDEATSSVDARTEFAVRQGMASLRKGRTSIVIAHRLSTIRDADLVMVMDSGRLVECGTHDELLAAGGAFARLHAYRVDSEPPVDRADVWVPTRRGRHALPYDVGSEFTQGVDIWVRTRRGRHALPYVLPPPYPYPSPFFQVLPHDQSTYGDL